MSSQTEGDGGTTLKKVSLIEITRSKKSEEDLGSQDRSKSNKYSHVSTIHTTKQKRLKGKPVAEMDFHFRQQTFTT